MDKISRFINQNKTRWLLQLSKYLNIPSISVPGVYGSKNVLKVADWLKNHFQAIGFKSKLIKTPYDPLIYAEYKNSQNNFTLLIYCHTDVQPPEPVDLWNTPPFRTAIKNGKIFARGVSDSKGHLFAYIKGIESVLKTEGKLPINIKFIIDCDEEANEISLPWFLKKNFKKLTADAVLISAGAMVAPNTPSICRGYRGLLAAEIKIKTLKQNLHSGSFGGAVLNAAECLSKILAQFRDKNGKILIPGFYDNVLPVNKKEKVCAGVHCGKKEFLKITGAKNFMREDKFALDECLAVRPTFEVNGIKGGSTDNAFQYIVVARALAKISFRLVPNQDPDEIFKKLKKFVQKITPQEAEVEVKKVDWARPILVKKKFDFAKILEESLKKIFNKKLIWYREGGAVPIVYDLQKINAAVFMVGFGSPNDNIHAPNEKLNLADFYKEIKFASVLMKCLGEKSIKNEK